MPPMAPCYLVPRGLSTVDTDCTVARAWQLRASVWGDGDVKGGPGNGASCGQPKPPAA